MKEDNYQEISPEITVDQLQDLLIYDDSFLDYFNEFLKLPVFPQPLEYQRLTDSFKIIELDNTTVVNRDDNNEIKAPFMSSEKEHAKLINWAQKYRLPLFLKTDLYRELKLSKLMMRPVEEFKTARGVTIPTDGEEPNLDRRRTYIHGYSRMSDYSTLASTEEQSYSSRNRSSNTIIDSSNNVEDVTTTNPTDTSKDQKPEEDDDEYDEDAEEYYDYDYNRKPSKYFDKKANSYYIYDDIPYDEHIRPGSEAISLPIHVNLNKELMQKKTRSNMSKFNKENSNLSQDALKGIRQKSLYIEDESVNDIFYRIRSAPLNFDSADFDFVYTNKVLYAKYRALNFGSKSEEEDESHLSEELSAIVDRQKISLHRLKEISIGNHEAMLRFRDFLANTAGKYLFDFWLECEKIKDSEFSGNEEQNVHRIVTVLRNLKDQFKLTLTKAAHSQIASAIHSSQNQQQLIFTFLQAQYDVLRRLRSYWLPRYILHQESLMQNVSLNQFFDMLQKTSTNISSSNWSIQTGLMPRLVLGCNLPITKDPIDIHSTNWQNLVPIPEGQILPAHMPNRNGRREKSNHSEGIVKRTVFQERIRVALAIDHAAGGPFEDYLMNLNMIIQINNLKFYQEVQKFKQLTKRNSERLLRLSHAWLIAKRFLLSTANEHIGLSDVEVEELIKELKKFKTVIDNSIFDRATEFSIRKLSEVWLQYLKEDVKKFLESSYTTIDPDCPPKTLDEIEVFVEGEYIIVKKKTISLDKKLREKTWDKLTLEEKRKRRAAALELKRITEIERKRVMKIVQNHLRAEEEERKMKAQGFSKPIKTFIKVPLAKLITKIKRTDSTTEFEEATTIVGSASVIEEISVEIDEPTPNPRIIFENKILFELFKFYISEKMDDVNPDLKNAMALLTDIIAYLNIKNNDQKTKREKSKNIHKFFLDQNAKRPVKFSDKLKKKIQSEGDRPRTPLFREIQFKVLDNISEAFQQFWKYETKELGLKSKALATIPPTELQLIAETQLSTARNAKSKLNQTADTSKEDVDEFNQALEEASYRPLNLKMMYFLKYLIDSGSGDFKNGLEKDLYFVVEVMKLQEICNTTVDEAIAKNKIQCITAAFFESCFPPAVQINVPNDITQRVLRAVSRQLSNRDVNISIFNEAQAHCIKHLMPYWAGFRKQWEETDETNNRPISKYRKILERRLKLYNDIEIPGVDQVKLPTIPKSTNITTFTYTMNEGIKMRMFQK